MLDEAFIKTTQEKLQKNLELLNHEAKEMEAEAKEGQETQIEDIDRAAADYDDLEKASKIDNLKEEKESVELALRKIAEGRFGLCEKCQKEIDKARLEILPTARLCMNCKIICDKCGEEIEEARILGRTPPLICQNCEEELEPETYFTITRIRPGNK